MAMVCSGLPTPDYRSAMRRYALISCLFLLTGCNSLQQLKDAKPSSDDFPSSLAAEYLAYADSESEQTRRFAAEYYAAKGVRALHGEEVLPESPDTSLSQRDQDELAAARNQLTAFLTQDMKDVAPQKLARAQLLFDCWQDQLSKNLKEELAPCAEEFKSTITELQDISDSLIYGKETSYAVSFAPKTTSLDDEGKAVIKQVATSVSSKNNYTVELRAYLGRGAAQRKLGERRLAEVRRALVKAGVPSRHIHLRKHGSAKAVILSGDKEPALTTKKVQITLKTHPRREENNAQ